MFSGFVLMNVFLWCDNSTNYSILLNYIYDQRNSIYKENVKFTFATLEMVGWLKGIQSVKISKSLTGQTHTFGHFSLTRHKTGKLP